MNEIVKKYDEIKVTSKEEQALALFTPFEQKLERFFPDVQTILDKEITPTVCNEAKSLRTILVKIRTSLEAVRKAEKADYQKAVKVIDGTAKAVRDKIEEKEALLKNVETYFERLEAERLQKLGAERKQILLKFGWVDDGTDLAALTEVMFNLLKQETERLFAEAEAERLEKERELAESKERIRKLELEKQQRDKQIAAERLANQALEEQNKKLQEQNRIAEVVDIVDDIQSINNSDGDKKLYDAARYLLESDKISYTLRMELEIFVKEKK